MDKSKVLDALLSALEEELRNAISASQDAADYATNEESRAESRWDTQGLEASYLAAGHAGQARHWAEAIDELKAERLDFLRKYETISLGAFFECEMDGARQRFIFAGTAGGQVLAVNGGEVTVITKSSPLAHRVVGHRAGDAFELPNGRAGRVLAVE